jgi:hypothetical protein
LRQYRRASGRVRLGKADHPGRRRQVDDRNDKGSTSP